MANIKHANFKRHEILKEMRKALDEDIPFKNKELMIALKLNEAKAKKIKCCFSLTPDHSQRLKMLSIQTGYSQSAIIQTFIDAHFFSRYD